MAMRRIDSARLSLEPQRAAHAVAMFEVLSDPALYEFEHAAPRSVEALRERFAKLETRRSADGTEQWLNWVLCLRGGAPIGYVQATVQADASALVAYVLASAHWGRGLASEGVEAMIGELAAQYDVHTLWAVFKRQNQRSRRLLERLRFHAARVEDRECIGIDDDEDLMLRRIDKQRAAGC